MNLLISFLNAAPAAVSAAQIPIATQQEGKKNMPLSRAGVKLTPYQFVQSHDVSFLLAKLAVCAVVGPNSAQPDSVSGLK